MYVNSVWKLDVIKQTMIIYGSLKLVCYSSIYTYIYIYIHIYIYIYIYIYISKLYMDIYEKNFVGDIFIAETLY